MIRRFRPGGLAWLTAHELRLALRGTGKRGWLARTGPLLLLAALPAAVGVVLAIALAAAARHSGPLPREAERTLHLLLGIGVVGLLLIMLSTASIAVLRTFHDRGDLDLLLSAPVPPARILAAKSVGVAIAAAAPFAVIVGPFALASLIVGQPQWLGLLAMIAIDAVTATALALIVTALLFDAVGPRRARTVVQLGAALFGGAAFLLTQLSNVAPAAARWLFAAVADSGSAFAWPGRAALGDLLPLAVMASAATALAALAVRFGARHLAASHDRGTKTRAVAGPLRFRTGLTRIVVAKELRLIVRDPELITQVALRLVYLIPLAALILRSDDGVDAGGLAGAATGFVTLLAASLAWIVVCAEDAPDLLAAAPVDPAAIARAKLIAAGAVPLAALAVAAAGIAALAAWAAAVTLVVGTLAVAAAALLQSWFGRPAPRNAFRRRRSGSWAIAIGEIALAAAASGTATLLARGSVWALAPALLGAMVMAGAIEARKTA